MFFREDRRMNENRAGRTNGRRIGRVLLAICICSMFLFGCGREPSRLIYIMGEAKMKLEVDQEGIIEKADPLNQAAEAMIEKIALEGLQDEEGISSLVSAMAQDYPQQEVIELHVLSEDRTWAESRAESLSNLFLEGKTQGGIPVTVQTLTDLNSTSALELERQAQETESETEETSETQPETEETTEGETAAEETTTAVETTAEEETEETTEEETERQTEPETERQTAAETTEAVQPTTTAAAPTEAPAASAPETSAPTESSAPTEAAASAENPTQGAGQPAGETAPGEGESSPADPSATDSSEVSGNEETQADTAGESGAADGSSSQETSSSVLDYSERRSLPDPVSSENGSGPEQNGEGESTSSVIDYSER